MVNPEFLLFLAEMEYSCVDLSCFFYEQLSLSTSASRREPVDVRWERDRTVRFQGDILAVVISIKEPLRTTARWKSSKMSPHGDLIDAWHSTTGAFSIWNRLSPTKYIELNTESSVGSVWTAMGAYRLPKLPSAVRRLVSRRPRLANRYFVVYFGKQSKSGLQQEMQIYLSVGLFRGFI